MAERLNKRQIVRGASQVKQADEPCCTRGAPIAFRSQGQSPRTFLHKGDRIVSRHYAGRWLFLLATMVGTTGIGSAALCEDALSDFMKAKLVHSQKTLEGLAKADYELIAKHSQAISLLCEDELWAVLKTPEYQQRSDEFRRSVNAITDAARKKNLEAATLAYVDSTLKCVSCHKYVRNTKSGR
jgi:cytochrome c556